MEAAAETAVLAIEALAGHTETLDINLISRVEEAQQKLNAKLIVDKGANAEHPKEDNPDSDNESRKQGPQKKSLSNIIMPRPEDKLLPDKESEPGMSERSQHIQNAALSAAADETAKTTVMSDIKFGCICRYHLSLACISFLSSAHGKAANFLSAVACS